MKKIINYKGENIIIKVILDKENNTITGKIDNVIIFERFNVIDKHIEDIVLDAEVFCKKGIDNKTKFTKAELQRRLISLGFQED